MTSKTNPSDFFLVCFNVFQMFYHSHGGRILRLLVNAVRPFLEKKVKNNLQWCKENGLSRNERGGFSSTKFSKIESRSI